MSDLAHATQIGKSCLKKERLRSRRLEMGVKKNLEFPPILISLSGSEKANVSHAIRMRCEGICHESRPYELATQAASILQQHLNPAHLLKIKSFYETGIAPYLLVKHLVKTDALPPTPTDDNPPEGRDWQSQVASLLGLLKLCQYHPASFLDEMGGRLYHMVMPDNNSFKSFSRSTKALNLHTEVVNGYFVEESPLLGSPFSPGAFGLICLRNPDTIPTTILPIEKILDKLSDDTLSQLMKPNFTVRSQSSFDRDIRLSHVPVFRLMANGLLGMRYSHSKLSAENESANQALLHLRAVIHEAEVTALALEPGDALIINNRICLHGRAQVSNREYLDGLNRWLVRIYGYDEAAMAKIKFDSHRQFAMVVNR
jgi:hypothetical protein